MPRFKMVIEYDGSEFVGWQRQQTGVSIPQSLEEALFSFCGETIEVVGAGRTDAGVHALAMVAHIDLKTQKFNANTVRKAVNFHLGTKPIKILDAVPVCPNFHSRFSAIRRRYLYRIKNRPSPPTLDIGRVWFVPKLLDTDAMSSAGDALIGYHDFTSFRAKHCQAASPNKTLDKLDIKRDGEEVHIIVEARSFLHHQVRNIVGTLKLVGEGSWSQQDVAVALAARDRAAAGPTAPANGLYLLGIEY